MGANYFNGGAVKRLLVTLPAMFGLILIASPAGAQTANTTPTELPGHSKAHRFWFYWPNILFAAGLLALIIGLAVMYYMKIMRPKLRGR